MVVSEEHQQADNERLNRDTLAHQDRTEALGRDNRPQVAQPVVDRFNKHLTNSEIAYINRIYHQDNDVKKDTIMDLKLGEIMSNTSNFFNVFLQEYTHKIYDTQLSYSSSKKLNDNDVFENLKIYIIAFVRYVTESDNIIYLGIILIFISIFIKISLFIYFIYLFIYYFIKFTIF